MPYSHKVEPDSKVRMRDHDPSDTKGLTKQDAVPLMAALTEEIGELQELMYAAGNRGMLVVFQGMDTAGKDGAINRLLGYVNVQSCRVVPFKVPTAEEMGHDFLWRIHKQTPQLGGITVFNRSHYEDVLVVRVHSLVSEKVWKGRYDQINEFESLIASANVDILKFYLHISKDEQEERLLAREEDPTKAWKLAVRDWKERELWDQYQNAYEDVLSKCSTQDAPWRIVPANKKWFRDLAVAEAVAEALRQNRTAWLERLEEIGRVAKAELAEFRAGS